MDLLEAKSRIAEALVESIFRRARYEIVPFRAPASPLRFGREDFSPDFRVTQATAEAGDRDFLVEVKYRPSVEQFISVETLRSGEPFRTVDLTEVKEFGLFAHNVEDHEELVRRIFELLTA